MEQYLPVIIACIGALIALVSFILGASGIVTFNGFRRDYEAESADLLRTNDKLRQELGDLKETCEILGHKINEQQQQLRDLSAHVDELSLTTQDADSKLYTRAKKMIDLGADLNEVVRECEIPQGEAELLFRVKGKPVKTAANELKAPELKPVPSAIPGTPSMADVSKMPDFGGMSGFSAQVMQAEHDASQRRGTNSNGMALGTGGHKGNFDLGGSSNRATKEDILVKNEAANALPLPKEASGLMEHFRNIERP